MKYFFLLFSTGFWFSISAQHTKLSEKDFTKPEATEQWNPRPELVSPGKEFSAPSDAIILFDGKNLDEWQMKDGSMAKWIVKNNILTINTGQGDLYSKRIFGDCQLHLEFMIPEDKVQKGSGTNKGNSGIFLQSRYEVQIYDSYNNQTPIYANGQTGSIYKQVAPMINAASKDGEWNRYDIFYTGPRFNYNGSLKSPAYITILLNGILIINHFAIQGSTSYIGIPRYEPHEKAALRIQSHGSAVSFRNIWIREIEKTD